MTCFFRIGLVAASVVGIAFTVQAQLAPLDYWTWANPRCNANSLSGMAFGNGVYVTVGNWGTVLVSRDGTNWQDKSFISPTSLNGIAFGNGVFVAYASDESPTLIGQSTSYLITSTNGENWNVTYLKSNPSIYARTARLGRIIWANGLFVVVGGNNSFVSQEQTSWIMTSPDGINWTTRVSGPGSALYSVTYAQNMFVAVGQNGVSMTSSDGIVWNSITTPAPGYYEWVDILFHGNRFIALANTGYLNEQSGVFSSTDGIHWNAPDSSITGNRCLRRVTAYGAKLLATGEKGATFVTLDATNWMEITVPISESFSAAELNGATVLTGMNGRIVRGTDGQPWQSAPADFGGLTVKAIASDDNCFVALGMEGVAAWSPDGRDWTTSSIPGQETINAATYANGKFVAVGFNNIILTSSNGISWVQSFKDPGNYRQLTGVAGASNRFVAVGWNGYSVTSDDGVNWQSHQTTNGYFWCVAAGNGLFVGFAGMAILTSTDGVEWTVRTNTSVATPNAMMAGAAYGNGRFVLAGDAGVAWVSTNGMDWSHVTILDGWRVTRVVYAGDQFVGVGDGGLVFSSKDGMTWERHLAPAPNTLLGVAYGKDTIVVTGGNGAFFRSDLLHGSVRTIRNIETTADSRIRLDILTIPGTAVKIEKSGTLLNWSAIGYYGASVGRFTYETLATEPSIFFRALPQ